MPIINLTLPETEQSVSRPVIFSVIEEIKKITKIRDDVKIRFPGDIQKMASAGSTVSDQKVGAEAVFETARYLEIDVDEDYDREAILSTPVNNGFVNPIFKDQALNVVIKPIYAYTTVAITFRYKCPSKSEAKRWREDMRMKVSQFRDINLHRLTYQYILPIEILAVLLNIYTLRENVAPYGQTFQEYLVSNFTDRLSVVSDTVGNEVTLTIADTEARVEGLFDFPDVSDKTEREESGVWVNQFTYKFTYSKPEAISMRYPIMVHNQLLPEIYTDFVNEDLSTVKMQYRSSDDERAFRAFESTTIMNDRVDPYAIVRLPEFDDYILKSVPLGTGTVLLALCEVADDKRGLLNLNELGDFEIDSDILDFIANSEYSYCTSLYKSIISIDFYKGNFLQSTNRIACDTNLNVFATSDLDLRDEHRVRFSLVTDLTLLDRNALDRLKKYPKAFVKIISALNELLRNDKDFNDLGDLDYISPMHFSNVYRILTGFNCGNGAKGIPGAYYGQGRSVSNWTTDSNLLAGIPQHVIDNYRNNRMTMKTVMVTGIIAANKQLEE